MWFFRQFRTGLISGLKIGKKKGKGNRDLEKSGVQQRENRGSEDGTKGDRMDFFMNSHLMA